MVDLLGKLGAIGGLFDPESEIAVINISIAGGGPDLPALSDATAAENAGRARFDGKIDQRKEAQVIKRLEPNVKGISHNAESIVAAAWDDIRGFAAAAEGHLKHVIRAKHVPTRGVFATANRVMLKLAKRMVVVVHHDIPTAVQAAEQREITRLRFVSAVLTREINDLATWARQTFAQVVADYTARINELGAWAASTFQTVIGDYTHRINTEAVRASTAEHDIVSWADRAITGEAHRAATAERDIAAWAGAAITQEANRAFQSEHDIVTWAGYAIDAKAAEVIHYTDIEAAAPVAAHYPALHTSQETMLADLGLLAPAAVVGLSHLPQLQPQTVRQSITAITTKVETCESMLNKAVSPALKGLGNFPHDLSNILSALGIGALLAFVTDAVTDPEGAAEVAAQIGVPILTPIGEAIDGLVGLL